MKTPSINSASNQDLADVELARIRAAFAWRANPDRYSLFDPAHLWMVQELERQILKLLGSQGFSSLAETKVLEVGCGNAYWLRRLIDWGARPENLFGIDLLSDRIAEARQRCRADITLMCGDATGLPFPARSFDVVFQSTVFTSILDARMKMRIASEMSRVVKPAGLIMWYDYRVSNPGNPDARGIGRREIADLFLGADVRLKAVTLAPPLTRALARRWTLACLVLSSIPVLCTHYLGAIRNTPSREARQVFL